MRREQAAALLGVGVDADSTAVRQAWRVWAKLAHPDIGGDREHFEALTRARDVLLATCRDCDPMNSPGESSNVPTPRASLRQVLRRPSRRGLLAIALMSFVTVLVILVSGLAPDAVSALMLGGVASGVAISVQRTCLESSADTGHRIALLVTVWSAVATLVAIAATTVGTELIPVLPVFVLPFVATVALVNPGAGLWRPVRVSS